MEQSKFERKVDELGRVVLPYELRNQLNIQEKDTLEIYITNGSFILKPRK